MTDTFSAALERVSPDALRPYSRNTRTHSKRQIKQIAASIKELDLMLGEAAEAGDPAGSSDDEVPASASGSPVSRLGDIWRLGDHRLFCGDSRLPDTFAALMAGEKAALAGRSRKARASMPCDSCWSQARCGAF